VNDNVNVKGIVDTTVVKVIDRAMIVTVIEDVIKRNKIEIVSEKREDNEIGREVEAETKKTIKYNCVSLKTKTLHKHQPISQASNSEAPLEHRVTCGINTKSLVHMKSSIR
jgi:hypothetical protein